MLETFTCKCCGTEFQRENRRGRKPHYCSEQCANKAAYKRQKARRPRIVKPSDPELRSYNAKVAADARWAGTPAEERAETARKLAASRWAGHEKAPEKPKKQIRRCFGCGTQVLMTSNQKTCGSKACRLAWNAERMRLGGWMKARRAAQTATQVEIVRPSEIFERDSWICGICGRPVDPELKYPHKMSASIDHIVPLSRGGDHVPDNLRCSHLTCNVARGNKTRSRSAA